MQVSKVRYDDVLSMVLPALRRRKALVLVSVLAVSALGFAFYAAVGERYEAYSLLRVGQGIKERANAGAPFADGVDLTSRMDSLARIAATDHVIRLAAIAVGPDRLFDEKHDTRLVSLRKQVSDFVARYGLLPRSEKPVEAEGLSHAVLGGLRSSIFARQEGRSDILRLSFRHRNPAVVADFTNELANALVAVQGDLVQVQGADIFFQQQAKRLEQEAEKAAANLQKFSIDASIYSVADQRSLLLKRVSELGSLIAGARGAVEDRRGQRKAIADQLLVMRPVTQSKTVTSIVHRLAQDDQGKSGTSTSNSAGNVPGFEESPPLLLVRVYQDAMASLMKINSDLNGSVHLARLLEEELVRVNAQLADLSSKEAEYDRLKRVLTRASSAAEQYGTRMIEEQTSLDIAKKTQLSSVRGIQVAEKPVAPMFPRLTDLVLLSLVGGVMAGWGMAIALEMTRRRQLPENRFDRERVTVIDSEGRRSRPVHAAE